MRPDHFYSDPHFGHHNIIRFSDRPFKDVDDMTEGLIARYNEVVAPNEFVLWCGDASMKISVPQFREIRDRLNGDMGLVRGNHDPKSISKCLNMGFDFVVEEMFLRMGSRVCRVKHYPYALSPQQKRYLIERGHHIDDRYPDLRPPRVKGEVLIHGHTHQSHKVEGTMVHVGVDAWDYRPVPWTQVADLVSQI